MTERGVPIEKVREYSIFLATPMYGGQCSGSFTKSCTDLTMLCTANGIKLRFYFLFNESLVQRARNYCVDEFLRSDCTHMMFIDSDIGFDPKDVLTLLAIQITDPEKYNVMTGVYPKKTIAWEKVQSALRHKPFMTPFEMENYIGDYAFNPIRDGSQQTFPLNEPMKIGEAATGFMLVPRKTYEVFAETYPELKYLPDHARTENFSGDREITAFFDCIIDPETRRYLSEDYFFSKKCIQANLNIWMCPWINLNHVGTYIFRGNLAALSTIPNTVMTASETSKKEYWEDLNKPYSQKISNQKKRNRNRK